MHSLPASLQEGLPIGDTWQVHKRKLHQQAQAVSAYSRFNPAHEIFFLLLAIHVSHPLVLAQVGALTKLMMLPPDRGWCGECESWSSNRALPRTDNARNQVVGGIACGCLGYCCSVL